MDVEIDNLEIKAGATEEKQRSRQENADYDNAALEQKIEECVERMLRQMMNR
ncbi:MAG: hypothetical protein ACFHU9_12100 [Fluviicola sp.]